MSPSFLTLFARVLAQPAFLYKSLKSDVNLQTNKVGWSEEISLVYCLRIYYLDLRFIDVGVK